MVAWFKHDIPAWMDGTEALDDGPYRAYHVICQLIYLNEGPIALNEHGIAGRCKQSLRAFRANLKVLLDCGKLEILDGRLSNSRAEKELENLSDNRVNAGKGGKKSGEVRKSRSKPLKNNEPDEAPLQEDRSLKTRLEKTREDETRLDQTRRESRPSDACASDGTDQDFGRSVDSPSPSEPQSQAASSVPDREVTLPLGGELILPEPQNGAREVAVSSPRAPRRGRDTAGEHPQFAEWYRQFPRHKAPKAAAVAYKRIVDSGRATPEELLAGAMRYAAEQRYTPPTKIKHPASWLNAECWLDEPDKPQQAMPGRRSVVGDFMAGIENYLTEGE